jgi:hypothetical protein
MRRTIANTLRRLANRLDPLALSTSSGQGFHYATLTKTGDINQGYRDLADIISPQIVGAGLRRRGDDGPIARY